MAVAIEKLFAPHCEIVIHNFADFEHSIVHLEGNVSNRRLGGAATDLLLRLARDGETDSDLHCYMTTLPGDRMMKSSTVFLRDESGYAYGAFCVNYDVSVLVDFGRTLALMTHGDVESGITEVLSDDINETIRGIISETLSELGAEPHLMSRGGKIDLMRSLDAKGIFQVKKAAQILAEQLGYSRATIYNYLREARERDLPADSGAADEPIFDDERQGPDDGTFD